MSESPRRYLKMRAVRDEFNDIAARSSRCASLDSRYPKPGLPNCAPNRTRSRPFIPTVDKSR